MATPKNIALVATFAVLVWGFPGAAAQSGMYPDLLPPAQPEDSPEAPAPRPDSLQPPGPPPSLDSHTATYFTRLRTAATRRRPPVHPYFRDEYRVMQDLRRLVQFVAPGRIHFFESLQQLVNIGNRLPIDKQTAIVQVAVAGGIAQIFSEEVNHRLQRRKIHFVRWDLERVVFRQKYRHLFSLTYSKGVTGEGVVAYFPGLRLHFRRYATPYYQIYGWTYRLSRTVSLDHSFSAGQRIFAIRLAPHRAYRVYTGYYSGYRLLNAYLEVRSRKFLICRAYYTRRLIRPPQVQFRGEVLVRW